MSHVICTNKIILSRNSIKLELGKSVEILKTIRPEEATNQTVSWFSSNESVAIENPSLGIVTGLGLGTAVITAIANDGSGVTASCSVNVQQEVLVEDILLNKDELLLAKSETFQLEATVYPDTASNETVTWYSGNSGVATVTYKGVVTAVGEGNVWKY